MKKVKCSSKQSCWRGQDTYDIQRLLSKHYGTLHVTVIYYFHHPNLQRLAPKACSVVNPSVIGLPTFLSPYGL